MRILRFVIVIILLSILPARRKFVNAKLTNIIPFTANVDTVIRDNILKKETSTLIDNQIKQYVELIKKTHGITSNVRKRSMFNEDIDALSLEITGVQVLNGFMQKSSIPTYLPKDILLFNHKYEDAEIWYAVSLEVSKTNKKLDNLVIYRKKENNYEELIRETVKNGVKLDSHTIIDTTYIVIAQNHEPRKHHPIEGSGVYQFTSNEQLYKIQTLDISYPTDVVIWEDMNDIFMIFIQKLVNNSNGIIYDVKSPIYKWLGKHFDIINYIDTHCAQKVIPFKIGHAQYVAVANYKNDRGETDIHSEIYKYDIHDEKFLPYQKIATHAAVDIKYFCFKQNNIYENYIVIANSYKIDLEGNINYQTNSIIYKFVEDYFMPFQSISLNNAEQWLPVVGTNGEFVLLVSCKYDGIKMFQYDGWRFIESSVHYTKEAFSNGVVAMHPYIYNREPTIVISNKNDRGNMVNVFTPTFLYQNVMSEFQTDIYKWCQQASEGLDISYLKELNKRVENAPNINDQEVTLNGEITFEDAIVNNFVLHDNKGSGEIKLRKNEERSMKLQEEIKEKSNQLKHLKEKIQANNSVILKGDVKVKNLNVTNNDRIIFEDLKAKSINDVNMDKLFKEIVFLGNDFLIEDNFEFEDVVLDDFTTPKFVNNKPATDLVRLSLDMNLQHNLKVNGNVIADSLIVEGPLQNITISEDTILLKQGDQTLRGSVSFSDLETDNIKVKYINSMEMKHLEQMNTFKTLNNSVTSLTVKNITIGYVNGIDMRSLERLALRSRGDQEIVSSYEFDTLIVDDFLVDSYLSDTSVPDDLVLVSNGTYFIKQDLFFTEDLQAKYFHVIERLNQILVTNGKMDILLKDYPEKQFISGYKTFEKLNLLGPVNLQGRIQSKGLDRMKPVIITERHLNLVGNYRITGNTTIEKDIKFNNILEESQVYSLNKLEAKGLKLNATEIPVPLEFKQQININQINVDFINNANVQSWIRYSDNVQDIIGRKHFKNDVYLNGETCVLSINGININDLFNNVLQISGDQVITKKYHFVDVASSKTVSNKTYVDNIPWQNVVTLDTDQYINGTTVITRTVTIANIEADSLEIKGRIMKHDFNKILADSVFTDTENTCTGTKQFLTDLSFNRLHTKTINNVDIEKLRLDMKYWLSDIYLSKPFEIYKSFKIQNIYFKQFNDIESQDFGNVWLLKEGNQTVNENQSFQNVYFNEGIVTESEQISELNLKEITEQSVKINEDHHFDRAKFLFGVESVPSLIISGQIKQIDFDTLIIQRGMKEQNIIDEKIIFNNLTIYGYLHVNSYLSGVSVSNLQHFVSPVAETSAVDLIINGSANFARDCSVNNMNDYNVQEMADKTWFNDQDIVVTGFMIFENVVFEDEVTVNGYVDDVNIAWLSKNYFSKTKEQEITAKLHFTNGVIFAKDILSEEGIIYGRISNIDLKKFYENILKNGDQDYQTEIDFDKIEISDFNSNGLVNNFNLSKDIMRADKFKNLVSGKKVIKNINTINLEIPTGVNIQNINLDYWFKNIILLNGNFSVDGLKTFTNVTFLENIELIGLLNSYLFNEEHILTQDTKQNIHGKKIYYTDNNLQIPWLSIENLKLKGNLNGINFNSIIEKELNKSKNVIISSKKIFYAPIIAANVNFDKLYQDIDVKHLIENITNLNTINTYEFEYFGLLNSTNKILYGLKFHAYYIDSFKVIQKIEDNVKLIIPLNQTSVAFVKNIRNSIVIDFYIWNEDNGKFILSNGNFKIEDETPITFMYPITIKNREYIYVERAATYSDYTYSGTMYEIIPNQATTRYNVYLNSTESVASLTLPNKKVNCIFTTYITESYTSIFCEDSYGELKFYKQLNITNVLKVSVLNINNITYIFTIHGKGYEGQECLKIWKYNTETDYISLIQSIYVSNPNSIDTIQNRGEYYVAFGLGNIEVSDSGVVLIYRYEMLQDKFIESQRIYINSLRNVKLSILSSHELVLYVTTDSPNQALSVYLNEGLAGFKIISHMTTMPIVNSLEMFSTDDRHFIFIPSTYEIRILEAIFKGKN